MIEKKIKRTKKSVSKPALLDTIIDAVKEKKGKDIVTVDLRKISSRVCDYFVICHADSNVHVQSISRGVEENVRVLLSERPFSKEGISNAQWVLIDYVSVVVHVLQASYRSYYNLEGLWADAKIVHHEIENED
jgi:ribosome-associated protein